MIVSWDSGFARPSGVEDDPRASQLSPTMPTVSSRTASVTTTRRSRSGRATMPWITPASRGAAATCAVDGEKSRSRSGTRTSTGQSMTWGSGRDVSMAPVSGIRPCAHKRPAGWHHARVMPPDVPEADRSPNGATLTRWGFASPGPLRDELTALALAGTKTTTAGLLAEYEVDEEPIAKPGEWSILVDSEERPVALIETISCRVERLADVAAFRVDHEKFWNGYIDDLRTQLGDPSFTLTDDTAVVLERFRVVERIDAVRWWDIYGRHGQALYGTPSFTFWQAPRTFALLTGEPNLDLNVCNLAPGATAEDAAALLAVIGAAGAPPTVVPVATRALPEAAETLRLAGFVAIGPEVAMWRPPMPVAPVPGPFAVRKA